MYFCQSQKGFHPVLSAFSDALALSRFVFGRPALPFISNSRRPALTAGFAACITLHSTQQGQL